MEGDNRKTVTLPAVMNDTVYIGGSGMHEGTLYAIDATNGSEKWHFNKDSKISSPPVAVDEVVCIGFEDKNLYGLDTVFGSEKWRYETRGKIDYCLPVSGTIYLGSHAGEIIALSGDKSQPETGTKTSSPSTSRYDDDEHFYNP
jgi:outer membrane protein assembly factor BamB